MILCIGTTPAVQRTMVFNRLEIDEVNRAVEVQETAAGKSVNVARLLRTLGQEVLATGFIGGDTGKLIREDLHHAGVMHEFVDVAPRTRTCITVIDKATGAVTELVEEAKAVEPRAWDHLMQVIDANLWRIRVMVLSGSLPPGGPVDFYARCTRIAREQRVPVILDAQKDPLKQALKEKPFVVKPNRSELATALGVTIDSEASLRDAMRRLIEQGPTWAVITNGASDVRVSNGEHFWRVIPPTVKAVNAIGSGDAFTAGLVTELLAGKNVPEACTLAAACGAANALTPVSGLIHLEDVERLRKEVRVEEG